MTALPPGERKKINDLGVFALTAIFSLFAYVWLIIILQVSSPNIIELWEGAVTFFFFPLLVWLAYLADVGVFKCIGICAGAGGAGASSGEVVALSHEGKEVLLDKAMDIISRAGGDADAAAEDLGALLAKKKTRAFYRVSASRSAGSSMTTALPTSTNCLLTEWSPEMLLARTSSMKPGPSGCSSPWMRRTISTCADSAFSTLMWKVISPPGATLTLSV